MTARNGSDLLQGVGAGRGHSVLSRTSGSEGMSEGTSLIHSHQNGEYRTYGDDLLRLGVYTLSRVHRETLAKDLLALGVEVADLERLRDYLRAMVDDAVKAQRFFVGMAIDTDAIKWRIEDLKQHLAQQAPRTVVTQDAQRKDLDFGRAIREDNFARVRRFDAEYEAWRQAKANGTAPAVERLPMPWERFGVAR